MVEDDDPVGDLPLFSLVHPGDGVGSKSLEELSGQRVIAQPDDTSLMRRVERAWRTQLELLTCEQARLLISQGMGLRWLASPVCELLMMRPDVEVSFYPGDLASAALGHFRELLVCAPVQARLVLEGDFSWIDAQREVDHKFGGTAADEAEELLRAARKALAK